MKSARREYRTSRLPRVCCQLTTVWVLGCLLITGGCKDKVESSAQHEDVAGQPMTSTPLFTVDGKDIAATVVGDDLELLTVSGLPPIADWQTLIVEGRGGHIFRGPHPMALTTKRSMKLVKQADGFYQFHVVELFHDDGPRVRHLVDKVERITIHTLGYKPPAVPVPPPPPLVLTIAGVKTELTESMLQEVKQTPQPLEKNARDTWTLLDLLGLDTLPSGQGVILRSESDAEVELSAAQINNPAYANLIKRNKAGVFHYRLWTLGESPERTDELRNVIEIELSGTAAPATLPTPPE